MIHALLELRRTCLSNQRVYPTQDTKHHQPEEKPICHRTVIIVFLTDDALANFQNSDGWEVGVDGAVALVEVGTGGSIDTSNLQDPIVGFVMSNKGLMYNLSLEGSKMTRIEP